jgi:hypothetical protein
MNAHPFYIVQVAITQMHCSHIDAGQPPHAHLKRTPIHPPDRPPTLTARRDILAVVLGVLAAVSGVRPGGNPGRVFGGGPDGPLGI